MKKLLFVMVVGFGAAMLVKNGQLSITPDKQIQFVGYRVALPGAVANSPLLGMVMSQSPDPSPKAGGTAARPALPIVSSANGSFDANSSGSPSASRVGPETGAAGFSAAAKALRGSQ